MSWREPVQLVLELPFLPALEAEDFMESASNAAALAMIGRWPDWPHALVVLSGPAGSGKSHLANVWRLRSGADRIAAGELTDAAIASRRPGQPLLIEDADRGIAEERAFFHLLNLAREQAFHVLVTARSPPGDWQIALPDLRSRLRAAPVAAIAAPDDALLRGVLVKVFADRQLDIEPGVVEMIARRIERSMEAAQRWVAELDRRALQERRRVSRRFVAEVLGGEEGEWE
jgi:chromosomal replication initiation ATPase DnaA